MRALVGIPINCGNCARIPAPALTSIVWAHADQGASQWARATVNEGSVLLGDGASHAKQSPQAPAPAAQVPRGARDYGRMRRMSRFLHLRGFPKSPSKGFWMRLSTHPPHERCGEMMGVGGRRRPAGEVVTAT